MCVCVAMSTLMFSFVPFLCKHCKDTKAAVCIIFDPFEYLMDLCNELCLLGWPVGRLASWPSFVAKRSALDITRKLFNQFFHTCHVYRLH